MTACRKMPLAIHQTRRIHLMQTSALSIRKMFRINFLLSLLFVLISSCSSVHIIEPHDPHAREREELVSLSSALYMAQNSYLKGCVDILQELPYLSVERLDNLKEDKIQRPRGDAFIFCRDLTRKFMDDVFEIMGFDPSSH